MLWCRGWDSKIQVSVWLLFPILLGGVALLLAPFPPLVDWPQHIALGVLLARHDDPQWMPTGAYCLGTFGPYHIFHHMVRMLYHWVGSAWVSRLMLLIIFLAYVASAATVLRIFRAEIRLLAWAIPLFFGFLYQLGFAPNMLAVPCFLWSIASAEYWRQSRTFPRGLVLLGCLLLTWLVHPLPFYMAMAVLGGFFLIADWKQWKHWLQACFWLSIPTIVALAYLWQMRKFNVDILPPTTPEPGMLQKLLQIPEYLMGISQYKTLEITLASLWILAWLGLWWYSRNTLKNTVSSIRWAKYVMGFLPLLAYFLAHNFMFRVFYVHQRFLWLSALLCLLIIPPVQEFWQRMMLMAGWTISVGFLVSNLVIHGQWATVIRDIYPLLPKVPQNTVMSSLVPPLKQRLTRELLLRSIHLEFQIHRGGVMRSAFTHIRRMPIVDCQPEIQQDLLQQNMSKEPWRFDPQKHGHHALYLLLRSSGDPHTDQKVFPWLYSSRSPYRPVARSGLWLLLHRPQSSTTLRK